MKMGELGKVYKDGDLVIRQGEKGDCMFVVQSGAVEIFSDADGVDVIHRVAGKNDFFGEMALVENDVRSASARAKGEARILHIDKRTFMRRVHEDPSLAYRIMESMAHEIRRLAALVSKLEAGK